MSDFDALASSDAPQQEEDPAADFLAREQDQLAGLEDDNIGGGGRLLTCCQIMTLSLTDHHFASIYPCFFFITVYIVETALRADIWCHIVKIQICTC